MGQIRITDDLEQLLGILPLHVRDVLTEQEGLDELVEVVMDLGRRPAARFPDRLIYLSESNVSRDELEYVRSRVGEFGGDNRAGLERTLHRISAIRNRRGQIVGLTCRVGRAVFGTIDIIRDVIETGQNILLLGRPGVGKTTMLREVARVLADEFGKRVIVVDTSNEIAGDGDVPHPGIGQARRMQVSHPERQHDVMIEAVENHMPEVIVIDEIGTEREAAAARTIAERGVQLIGTAHGDTLDNLILNPTLSDLVGGVQAVTLGDEEARRRGTQKTVLERRAPPTFDVVIEIQDKDRLAIHADVAETVDVVLRGLSPRPEVRVRRSDGSVETRGAKAAAEEEMPLLPETVRVFPYGVSRNRLERAARAARVKIEIARDLAQADMLLTVKAQERKATKKIREAEARGIPVRVIRTNTIAQMESFLHRFLGGPGGEGVGSAIREAEDGVRRALLVGEPVELSPRPAYARRLQHELAKRYQLHSCSIGSEPNRRVVMWPPRSGKGKLP